MRIDHFLSMRSGAVGASSSDTGDDNSDPCSARIISVQTQIGVEADGLWGPKSQKALDATGKSFKDFAPGCTGNIPYWEAGAGVNTLACGRDADTCSKTSECCGSLICDAGACAQPATKAAVSSSSTVWWVLGSMALAATAVGITYGTGVIGPKRNPIDPNTRYVVVAFTGGNINKVYGNYLDPAVAERVARALRNAKNSQGAAVVREVWWNERWQRG